MFSRTMRTSASTLLCSRQNSGTPFIDMTVADTPISGTTESRISVEGTSSVSVISRPPTSSIGARTPSRCARPTS